MVTCSQGPSPGRVSFETSFDSKQPILEPKLVSVLSETKRLFWLFLFYTETESFSVSFEIKQTEEQPKQCDREHILVFLSENWGLFRFVLVCFETVCFSCFASIPKQRVLMFLLNRNKQKINRNSLIESIFWYFKENLGLFPFVIQFYLFQLFWYRFETPKQTVIFVFSFMKQTKTQTKQILFWFVSVQTEKLFCLFRGHPIPGSSKLHPKQSLR